MKFLKRLIDFLTRPRKLTDIEAQKRIARANKCDEREWLTQYLADKPHGV